MLEASGPASLAHLHRQAGDVLTLLWCLNTPWPLPAREYMMVRKVGSRAELPGRPWRSRALKHSLRFATRQVGKLGQPPAGCGDDCYLYLDSALEERESLARAPKAKGAVRVVDYQQAQPLHDGAMRHAAFDDVTA